MTKLLGNLNTAILMGLVLLFIMAVGLHSADFSHAYATPVMLFLHVLSGIVWIGLLYYFNLVQIPTMPKVPAELKGGVTKYIAPEALFWFRWGAVATLVTGLGVAGLKGYTVEAFTLQPGYRAIGLGMYLAIFMAANVWIIIWPNQQRALGLVPADDAAKATSGRIAMLGSRTNFILSLPMLYGMITQNYLAS
ncbi:urate hydroxylase PuuD [Sphingosinicellaceae bacterium]|nr:urate hydroxylase PuuD [Sphingosinicellaceae bacterium]